MTGTRTRAGRSRTGMPWSWKPSAVFSLLGTITGAVLAATSESYEEPPTASIMPEVVFVAPERLQPRACPEGMKCLPSLALYEGEERRIYLSRDWSPDNFHDLGILLHEFIHHLQIIGKLEYPCGRGIEIPAYALQEAFYNAHAREPAGRVPSGFTRFTRYSCAVDE